MGSVRPHSQAVVCPAFQHWRDIGALSSPLDNNVTSVPVVHHAKGIQNNMVATLYPEEFRVAYSPAQWQQGSHTPSKQNFQGYTQSELQRTIAKTRFQDPNSGNSASSSKNVFTQHSSCLSSSANKNTVRDSVNEAGRQSGFSEQKGSNLNINPGLSQRQLNAFSVCTPDTVAAHKRKLPLLHALLASNSSSSSGEMNANIELNTRFSEDRDCQSQQMKSSLAALNCGKSRKLHVDHSGATHSSTCQQQFSFPSLSSQPSTNIVLPVGKMAPPTDDEIMEFIRKKIAYFRTLLNPENINIGLTFNGCHFRGNEGNAAPQSDCIMSNDVAHSRSTSTSDKDVERNGLYCAAAVGQTLQQDSSKGSNENVTLTPKSREMSHCATSTSKEHSTGTQASVVGNSKHTPKTFVEKSTLVEFDNLDVNMPVNYDDKCFYLGDCENETIVHSNNESFHSKWCDKYLQTGVTTLRYTLTALKELIASLENVETIAGMDNFPEVLLQQYWNRDIDNLNLFASTEYPQIMEKVAATCTKNEDKSPVVLTEVSETDLAKLIEYQPSSSLNCSSSQEEPTPVRLNIVKSLDDIEQMSGVSWALKHTREREKEDTGHFVKMVGMDNVQGVTDVSEDRPTKSSSVVYEDKTFEPASLIENQDVNTKENCDVTRKKVIAPSKLIVKIQIHNLVSVPKNRSALMCSQPSHEGVKKDGDSVHSETDVSAALYENKVKGYSPPSQSKSRETDYSLKDLQYDDISSEDENSQIENVALQKSSLAQVPTGNRQLPCGNKSYGHEQVQAQMKTKIISEKELISRKQVSPETETCISCSPSSVLKDGDEIDDQMDDDWIVIPISMYDLKFEREDEECDSQERVVLDNGETGDKETESDTDTSPIPASVPSQMEVFDTLEKYLQEKSLHGFGWRSACSTPEQLDSCMPSHTLQSRRASYSESEDSYETEDSCDYPFESKQNLLTVSSELLEKGLTPALDDSESEKESEDDEVIDVQRPGKLIESKAASEYVQHESNGQISKIDIIVIDSDTEDDSDQNCRTMAKRKTISSDSDDSRDVPCSQNSPKKKLKKKRHKQSMSEGIRNTKRTYSSESEDSGNALIAGKVQPSTETMKRLCGTAEKKSEESRLSSEDAAKKQLQSVGKEADTNLRPNHVVHNSTGHLKLIKESRVHRQGNDETRASKNPKGTSKNTDSCEKKKQHLHKKVKVPASKAKPKQLSSPSQEGAFISTASSSSTSGQLSDPRQSSASSKGLFQTRETSTSCSLPKSKQSTSTPRQNASSSNAQLSRSYSIPATLDTYTPTKDPSSSESILSTTRKQVIKDWKKTFFPTKMERKINSRKEVESRTTNLDSSREARPGHSQYDRAPRRRHNSHETVTPLMKKAKCDAVEWTKAINREDPKKRKSFSVGDNYKWSEKATKGSYKSGRK
ncbi:hypothetical protein E3U43_020770 [Larimichthys crocea]|uniref:Uncharacterized protein n=1 Tax=Larimichthys crocea TaxID=215358 RepID=A0ACD3Q6H4_LARCR|nr:hypothetical protein E3U43_020770 [Larimichthys crocea]